MIDKWLPYGHACNSLSTLSSHLRRGYLELRRFSFSGPIPFRLERLQVVGHDLLALRGNLESVLTIHQR